MANASSSMWKTECLVLRGMTGFFLILSSLCHAHASVELGVDLMKRGGGCIEIERRSLLAVKAGIYQPPGDNWLSTWRDGTDCCSWQGVGCDNVTGHVVELDLRFIHEDDNLHPGPNNNLSGILSPSSLNFSAMLQTLNVNKPMLNISYFYKESLMVIGKGMELVYTTMLSLVISIDLSCNGFYGEIPTDLTKLHGLIFLNLSRNHFTGEIPKNIGFMEQLESLDLSMNNLSGSIPPSMSNLNFLGQLNLSHNNLSGRIPSGNHFQSFIDPSIYSGNLELCGWPLLECSINEPAPSHEGGDTEEKKDETDVILIYGIAASGFIIGFWSVIGTLLIKVSWRITYFQLVDKLYDWVYVKLAISIARWKSIILKD